MGAGGVIFCSVNQVKLSLSGPPGPEKRVHLVFTLFIITDGRPSEKARCDGTIDGGLNESEGEDDLYYMSMRGDAVDNGSPYFHRDVGVGLFNEEVAEIIYGKNKSAVDNVLTSHV